MLQMLPSVGNQIIFSNSFVCFSAVLWKLWQCFSSYLVHGFSNSFQVSVIYIFIVILPQPLSHYFLRSLKQVISAALFASFSKVVDSILFFSSGCIARMSSQEVDVSGFFVGFASCPTSSISTSPTFPRSCCSVQSKQVTFYQQCCFSMTRCCWNSSVIHFSVRGVFTCVALKAVGTVLICF